MTEVILCIVAICFLGWVFVLKAELKTLKEENKKIRAKLQLGIREMTKDVDIVQGSKSWGKKTKDSSE